MNREVLYYPNQNRQEHLAPGPIAAQNVQQTPVVMGSNQNNSAFGAGELGQTNVTGGAVSKSTRSFSDLGSRTFGKFGPSSNYNRGRVIMNATGRNDGPMGGANPSESYMENLNK